MPTLGRWVPRPTKAAPAVEPTPPALRLDEVSDANMAFCAEFVVHGGVAVSEQGFRGEGDLIRMQRAGLLDLQRDSNPPHAVTRVALSTAAREMLAGGRQAGGLAAKPPADDASREDPVGPPPETATSNEALRRHGFEVARGMISVGVKAELAAWRSQGEPGGILGLETKLMGRVSQIQAPFRP